MSEAIENEVEGPKKGERIAKRLSRAGVCSRRDAELLIEEGRVEVNGNVLTTPATIVTDADRIMVDGVPVRAKEPVRLWRYHKPRNLVTSHRDPQGRPTVFDAMPDDMPRVMSIGRLDFTSEGLLLLTNDGDLARRLELPSTGWLRVYRVRVHGRPDPDKLAGLAEGAEVDGVRYGPITAEIDKIQGANAWITMSLKEGKNREIRKLCEHMGYPVARLIRTSYGPFQLGLLEPGEVDEVPARVLRDQLGVGPAPKRPILKLTKTPAPASIANMPDPELLADPSIARRRR
jgi:23S rRNA pseudouridine2605 synthase